MSEFTRLTAINDVQLIEVIEVKSIIGEGTHESPIIEITEYYSKDGLLLARRDPTEPLNTGVWSKEL